MADDAPFGLPEALLDEAMAVLLEAADNVRDGILAELQRQHPEHADGLAALRSGLRGAEGALASTFKAPEPLLEEIAGYRVLSRLGDGAFGVVYLGQQNAPFRRQVAIKVLRSGAPPRAAARFHAERQFVATMRHPAVPQIFDAGVTADGRPWYAMEHVPGLPITDWCNHQRLTVTQRLQLFCSLCLGVQHVHDQGVVHRDLKPANVLVVAIDGEPQPRILDFGMAQGITAPEADGALPSVVGSPGYMSPEQSAGDGSGIDARSDVWSLGALLYELLAGVLPWGSEATPNEPFVPPAKRLAADVVALRQQAHLCATTPAALLRQLGFDLGWIVQRALAPDRGQRYRTAAELATDVRRSLGRLPVHAAPASVGYGLRCLLRRRAGLIVAVCLSVLMVTVTLLFVRHHRNASLRSGEGMRTASERLLDRANDPRLVHGGGEPLRRALASDAREFYALLLQEEPTDSAARSGHALALLTLSRVCWLVGDFEAAIATARQSVTEAGALTATAPKHVPFRLLVASAEHAAGRGLAAAGQTAAARACLERAVKGFADCAADGHENGKEVVNVWLELAATLDPVQEASARADLLRRAHERQRAVVASAAADTEARDLLVELEAQLGLQAIADGKWEAAAEWAVAAAARAAVEALRPGTQTVLRELQATLCDPSDGPAVLAARQATVDAARAWVAAAPFQAMPRYLLCRALLQLAEGAAASDPVASATAHVQALDAGEKWLAEFPVDPMPAMFVVDQVRRLAAHDLASCRRADVLVVLDRADRAAELLAKSPSLRTLAAPLRAATLAGFACMRARLVDAAGRADADAVWQAADAAMTELRRTGPIPDYVVADHVDANIRLAGRHLRDGRVDAAAERIDEGHALLRRHLPQDPDLRHLGVEIARLQAELAASRGNFAAVPDMALAPLAYSDDWRAELAAANAMLAGWSAARARTPAVAAGMREATLARGERALQALTRLPTADSHPALAVRALRLRLCLAEVRSDAGLRVDRAALAADVAGYAAWREVVRADLWEATVLQAGNRLLQAPPGR